MILMLLFQRRAPAMALAAGLALLAAPFAAAPAAAQTTATVTVNAGTDLATIGPAAFGVNTAVWDGNLMDSAVPGLLTNAGIGALRYPGGSTSDQYNWQTNAIVPGQSSFANPNNDFDAFMGLVKKIGATPVITVNYGSNTAGNGGGTPAFAASWVQYANVTKGYGVKYWEIGNEVYGNGEYGADWEADLHSAHDPTTYGSNVAQFATAMKSVDPTVKIGAVLTAPGNWPDGQTPNWNTSVLAQCGTSIDFVIVHWYPQNPGNESDPALLGAPESGDSNSPAIASMVASLKSLIKQFGGTNAANIQILVTETNSVSSDPGKQTISVVNSMFVADDVATWIENGVANVDVWALHNGSTGGNTSSSLFGTSTFGDYGILSDGSSGEPAADTPFPTYYGLEMLAALGKPGDSFVSTSSSNKLLVSHAVAKANGDLALLLLNKDPSNTTSANISISGFTPASTATVLSYGKTSSAITSASLAGTGPSFTVSAPPYSLTTIVMTPGTTTPGYALSAQPAGMTLTQGGAAGTATIAVAPSNGFTGAVALTASGLPTGVTASFSPASTSGSSTLTLTAAKTATTGTAIVTITGTSGSLSHQTSLAVTVNAATVPDFGLTAGASSLTLMPGGSATASITIAPKGGFAGAVALAASGMPAGVTASFSPASATSTSTLTLTAGSKAAAGSATVTVTGTSGSLSHTATIPVTVSAPTSPPPTNPPPTTPPASGGPATFTGKVSANSEWFDEDDVALTATAPITAMTLTITVPATNFTFSGQYNTIGSAITDSHANGASIVYTFTLGAGQVINPGSYTFAAQMDGNGTTHAVAGDTWSVTFTSGGKSFSQSGGIVARTPAAVSKNLANVR
jgi:hypothetical protein